MAETRGVFCLITDEAGNLLVSERADGKGWNLPGGRQEEGEDDRETARREALEELGLEVEVLEQVGVPLIFNGDTAVAYRCKVVGGKLALTPEAKEHRYVNSAQAKKLTWAGLRTYCMVLTSFYVKAL